MEANAFTKPLWRTIAVKRRYGADLIDGERLSALVRWLRGEPSPDDQFFDLSSGSVLVDPMDVSWAQFPLQDALEEIPAMAQADSESASRRRRARDPRGGAREQTGRSTSESREGHPTSHAPGAPTNRSDQAIGGE